MDMRHATRGQASIVGLVMTVFAIFVFLAIYPAVSGVITTALPSLDPVTQQLVQFILPFIMLGLLVTFFIYIVPQRETG